MPVPNFIKDDLTITGRTYSRVAFNVPEWQAGVSYEAGDLIIYGGDLLVCDSSHISAGSFSSDASRWSSVSGNADKHYTHSQPTLSSTWVVNHNLDKYPSVRTLDSGLREIEGDVSHVTTNSLVINFNVPVSGIAVIN